MTGTLSAPRLALDDSVAIVTQGYVWTAVSAMREQGVFETRPDPEDRRRTLVRVSDTIPETLMRLGTVSIDDPCSTSCALSMTKSTRG